MTVWTSYCMHCNALVLIFLFAGCNQVGSPLASEETQQHPSAREKAEDNRKSVKSESTCRIRAGYGIPECHLGMAPAEVPGDWLIDDEFRDEYRHDRKRGIMLVVREGKMSDIWFYVRPQKEMEMAAYPCGTDKGISRQSTLADVRAAYGEPSYIGRREYKYPDDDGTPRPVKEYVMYVELGIEFRYVGGALNMIGVFPPENNFDYEGLQKLMGDWIVYMRPRENRPAAGKASAEKPR